MWKTRPAPQLSLTASLTFPSELHFFFFRNLFNLCHVVIDYLVLPEGVTLGNPLSTLLELPEQEKVDRGLVHTPREIWQQPDTWITTYRLCAGRQADLNNVLRRAGIGRGSTSPAVYLVGAGTSDYTGRALVPLLRRRWSCDAWPLPSTTLLTDFDDFHRAGREYLWIS